MEINTSYFGPVQVDPAKIIYFPDGIWGFEDHREFLVLDVPEKRYKCLQSVKEELISFIIVNPWDYYDDYEFEMSDDEFEKIGAKKTEQLAVFNILTIRETLQGTTVNLLAPLVINVDEKKGRQMVLNESRYTTRMPLFPEGQTKEREAAHADTD